MDQKPVMRGAVAGTLALGTMLTCIALGAGIGALVGAVAPLVAVGAVVGIFAGMWVVYQRFKDL